MDGDTPVKKPDPASTIHVTMNRSIERQIEYALQSEVLEEEYKERVRQVCHDAMTNGGKLPFAFIEDFSKRLMEGKDHHKLLNQLICDSKWYFAEGDAPKKRDRQSESVVETIRNDAADREYRRMTANVDPTRLSKRGEFGSIGREIRQAKTEMYAVFNFIITVCAGFVFGCFASQALRAKSDMFANVLAGIGVAVVVALADLYFLLRQMAKSDRMPVVDTGGSLGKPKPVEAKKKE